MASPDKGDHLGKALKKVKSQQKGLDAAIAKLAQAVAAAKKAGAKKQGRKARRKRGRK